MSIHFGVDYYPEHWPKERLTKDVQLMKELGIQVVRMGEFSWFKMEPSEGDFHFEWLDEAIEALNDAGIKTVLGTPTAAPPAWIIEKNPEILPVDEMGLTRHFGGRHHDCQSNAVYRNHIKRLVSAYTKHFADNPGVIGWQVDNELGTLFDLCTCESCTKAFQTWLKNKYKSIEALNEGWGTAFWSQGYNSFEQIESPRITAVGRNPSAMLDWKCYKSDQIVDFAKLQTDIIRENCPNHFVTHNFMCMDNKVDYYDLAKQFDFVSNDIYPSGNWHEIPHEPNHKLAADQDVIRGFKKQPFWMMEMQSGAGGWEITTHANDPGQLAVWAFQAIAHGADCIVFFRWRTCCFGTEQFWHGILPHSGIPGRNYKETKAFIDMMAPYMDEIEGSMPTPEVAIVHSYRQNYALDIQPQHPDLEYRNQLYKYYKGFYDKQIPVDFVSPMDDFSSYKLIVAPLQYLMNSELEQHYMDYVKEGGHLILTMRCGVKDENNICMSDYPLPGRLSEACGITVDEYDCLFGIECSVLFERKEYKVEKWADIISLKTAEPLGSYSSNFYKGTPAITKNQYGKGVVWYVGCEPSDSLMSALIASIAWDCELRSLGSAESEVELVTRTKDNVTYLFVINHSNEFRHYKLHQAYTKLEGIEEGKLKPYEIQLFKKQQ